MKSIAKSTKKTRTVLWAGAPARAAFCPPGRNYCRDNQFVKHGLKLKAAAVREKVEGAKIMVRALKKEIPSTGLPGPRRLLPARRAKTGSMWD